MEGRAKRESRVWRGTGLELGDKVSARNTAEVAGLVQLVSVSGPENCTQLTPRGVGLSKSPGPL